MAGMSGIGDSLLSHALVVNATSMTRRFFRFGHSSVILNYLKHHSLDNKTWANIPCTPLLTNEKSNAERSSRDKTERAKLYAA